MRLTICPHQVSAVEGVYMVAPELGHTGSYWAINQNDRCLWHERYEEAGTGEEGDLELLEPDVFAPTASSSSSDSDSSASSDSEEEGEGEGGGGGGRAARPSEAAEAEQQMALDDMMPELF